MNATSAAAPGGVRSLLFVPGDSERKQSRALTTDADALILDLEDSVDAARLPGARRQVAELLRSHPVGARPRLWVRVNPPAGALWREDLAALFAGGSGAGVGAAAARAPAGIVLPKISAPAELVAVARELTVLESRAGITHGATALLVIATETPRGLLTLPQYPAVLDGEGDTLARLAGLTWGAEDLAAALGAAGRHDRAGELTFTFQMARNACLLAAAALCVQAIDGVYTRFTDADGLRRELENARRDGFSGKLAIHPDQVAAINAAFTPTEAECEHARRVLAACAASGGGVASLDGQMIDRPHLLQAQRVLAAARRVRGG